ncbi:MAG: biotin transporter BioY [Neomegalonema sp.]|nr:biotin transporter BioY [Neomegalonema sp.]
MAKPSSLERDIALIAMFAALIAALGLLPKVMLATGVPITAQSFGVMLAGAVLGAKRGFLAVLLFVALTVLGLPLLAGGRGGLAVLASPTVGFVIGFPFAALATGFLMEIGKPSAMFMRGVFAAILGGIVVLYGFGIPGMAIRLEKDLLEAAGFALPYLPGDLLKAVLTGAVVASLYRARPGVFAYQRAGR